MGDVCTLQDFITECNTFKYSKEYFEMVKLSSEISLAEQYIESCSYINEHADLLKTYDEYFCEKDPSKFTKVAASIKSSKETLFQRIVSFLKRLLTKFKNAVVGLWKKVFSKKNKDLEKSIHSLIKQHNNTAANFIRVDAVIDRATEILQKYPHVAGMKLTQIRDLGYSGISDNKKKMFYYAMTLAFDDKLSIKRHLGDNSNEFVITLNEYNELFNALLKDENTSLFMRKYKGFKSDTGSIEFSIEENDLNHFLKDLDQNLETLRLIENGNKIVLTFNDLETSAINLFSELTGFIITFFTELAMCRSELIQSLRDGMVYGDTVHRIYPNTIEPNKIELGDKKSELDDFDKINT